MFTGWLEAGESTSLLYPVMSKLQSLLEVEEMAQVLAGQREVRALLLPWKQRLPTMDADYRHVEPVLSLRCVLLHLLLSHSTENGAGNGGGVPPVGAIEELYSTIGATLLWQAELARKAGQYQVGGASGFCPLRWPCSRVFTRRCYRMVHSSIYAAIMCGHCQLSMYTYVSGAHLGGACFFLAPPWEFIKPYVN